MTQIGSSTPTYDLNGNVTNDFLHTYAWDANGRPVTADGVGLTYDALGRMVEQNRSGVYTEIVYGPGGGKLALMSGQTLQKAFVALAGGSSAVYNSSGLAYYRHSDWLGSSRFASTPSRTIYSDGAYAPFGEPYAQSGTTDLSFTGMNQDTVTNLYDFPAREYGIQGRWPSPDPAGLGAASLANPQSLNRYAYAANSPASLTDPTGLCPGWGPFDNNKGHVICTEATGLGSDFFGGYLSWSGVNVPWSTGVPDPITGLYYYGGPGPGSSLVADPSSSDSGGNGSTQNGDQSGPGVCISYNLSNDSVSECGADDLKALLEAEDWLKLNFAVPAVIALTGVELADLLGPATAEFAGEACASDPLACAVAAIFVVPTIIAVEGVIGYTLGDYMQGWPYGVGSSPDPVYADPGMGADGDSGTAAAARRGGRLVPKRRY